MSSPGTRSTKDNEVVVPRARPQLRFGHIPGNALTVEGLQRKLEPLSFGFGGRNFQLSLAGRLILEMSSQFLC